MRILLASSEVHPYSKTGGLGDMVGALGKALARAGNQVGVVTPLYGGNPESRPGLKPLDWYMDLPLGTRRIQAEVWTLNPEPNLTIYFIRQPELFDRKGIYLDPAGQPFLDNCARFVFYAKAVTHLARYLPWQPQLVHLHDWQTGLVPLFIQHQKLTEGWTNPPRTCLTIHNLAYQGVFASWEYPMTNLPWEYFTPALAEFYGGFNCLKAGIVSADQLTTVSPRYAREITTNTFGEGLDDLLRARQDRLVGILNGVDYDEWNTDKNPALKHPYSAKDLAGKTANKLDLQREMGLTVSANTPLFGNISRLVDQKGSNLLLSSLEEMLSNNFQFVQLGSGAPDLERALRALGQRYPGKVAVKIGFDQALSHRIEAGCDFFVMPSKFEPCGLNQMYSLRYGSIPIVRAVGGLDDSVIDIAENTSKANGIKFYEFSTQALSRGIRKALVLYDTPELFVAYRHAGMTADFSWQRTGKIYQKLYRAIGKH